MRKLLYLIVVFITCSCMSETELATKLKNTYPNEIELGTVIQLSNNSMMNSEAYGTFILGSGTYHSESGDEYFYTGLYKDKNGYINTFKLPACDVCFVESNECTITKIEIHKYLDLVANRCWAFEANHFAAEFINSSLYVKSGDFESYDFSLFQRPKIRISIPMDSIQKYINITY